MIKNTLLVSLIFFVASISHSQTPPAPSQVATAPQPATATLSNSSAVAAATTTGVATAPTQAGNSANATANASVGATETASPVTVIKKRLTLKEKIKDLWAKITNFDFSQFNILGKTEKFVAAKKKQNVEAMEGAETGVWKHTTRKPASGKAKEIADKLDQQQAQQIKKYDINSY